MSCSTADSLPVFSLRYLFSQVSGAAGSMRSPAWWGRAGGPPSGRGCPTVGPGGAGGGVVAGGTRRPVRRREPWVNAPTPRVAGTGAARFWSDTPGWSGRGAPTQVTRAAAEGAGDGSDGKAAERQGGRAAEPEIGRVSRGAPRTPARLQRSAGLRPRREPVQVGRVRGPRCPAPVPVEAPGSGRRGSSTWSGVSVRAGGSVGWWGGRVGPSAGVSRSVGAVRAPGQSLS